MRFVKLEDLKDSTVSFVINDGDDSSIGFKTDKHGLVILDFDIENIDIVNNREDDFIPPEEEVIYGKEI